jgi:two-component system chemotaxis response regulator CheB
MTVTTKPVKVILVDDSNMILLILKRVLAKYPEIEVVGSFKNGKEAFEAIPTLQPDVICTDYHMPIMNGLELIKEVMEKYPRPILVISSSVQTKGDEDNIFNLLDAGAVDVFPKPVIQLAEEFERFSSTLVKKITLLSGVHAFRRKRKVSLIGGSTTESTGSQQIISNNIKLIAIGTSTGGPQLLAEIFQKLPATLPFPIVCVQHISEGFVAGLVEWLNKISPLSVEFAKNGELPERGKIYFPPEDTHLKFDKSGRFFIARTPPNNGHRPSVSETFLSVAEFYKDTALGILLTGMGSDGADGLLKIKNSGGFTIAQNEKSCVVYGMPKVAVEMGAANLVLSPSEIIQILNNLNNKFNER